MCDFKVQAMLMINASLVFIGIIRFKIKRGFENIKRVMRDLLKF